MVHLMHVTIAGGHPFSQVLKATLLGRLGLNHKRDRNLYQ